MSGFFGYLLIGFYIRKFLPALSWRRTLAAALPLGLVGWLVVALFFFCRIPNYGAEFPVSAALTFAVSALVSARGCAATPCNLL